MVDLAEMGEILRRRRMARTYILGYCVCCESKELQDICVDTKKCRECLGITSWHYCGPCRGAGHVPIWNTQTNTIVLEGWKVCPYCDGSGKVFDERQAKQA
jgi:DnaJ-class molecular chaperone